MNVRWVDDVFDARDAAPLRDRALHPEFLAYVMSAMDERGGRAPVNLALVVDKRLRLDARGRKELAAHVRAQLVRQRAQLRVRLSENFRAGRVTLLLGLVVLSVFVALSHAAGQSTNDLAQTFQEGFLIIGTVALWRPVEILLYEWWPVAVDHRKLSRLLSGTISTSSSPLH